MNAAFSLAKSGQVATVPFHDSRAVTFWEPWNRYPSVHKGYWGQWRSHEGTGVDELIWAKNKMCGSSAGGLRKADIGGWYENFTRNEILPSFRTVPVQKKTFSKYFFFFFFSIWGGLPPLGTRMHCFVLFSRVYRSVPGHPADNEIIQTPGTTTVIDMDWCFEPLSSGNKMRETRRWA